MGLQDTACRVEFESDLCRCVRTGFRVCNEKIAAHHMVIVRMFGIAIACLDLWKCSETDGWEGWKRVMHLKNVSLSSRLSNKNAPNNFWPRAKAMGW